MKNDIYKLAEDPERDRALAVFRNKCAETMGVTLQGNRLTLRSKLDGKDIQMHAVIIYVYDLSPNPYEDKENSNGISDSLEED